MSLGALTSGGGKYAVPAGGLMLADVTIGGVDIETYGAILIGLVAGGVLRSAGLIEAEADSRRIRRDMLVSLASGLANFIVSAILVASATYMMPGFPSLAAAGVGLLVGFKGKDGIQHLRELWGVPRETRIERLRRDLPPGPHELPGPMLDAVERLDDPDRKEHP
ncbi:hypothetical protein [Aurantiacibacter luteus]|uniref:Holin n=1 Tax=Aurantiacibacter luteus TaxID=1581420 RepID=A0A0G9MP31_9SPHN|nr:hypothetical protein [Aurantiacibacter luteus]KLE32465.1 hypothetical protein AAW00_13660 [Aurantiacibacter luteus]